MAECNGLHHSGIAQPHRFSGPYPAMTSLNDANDPDMAFCRKIQLLPEVSRKDLEQIIIQPLIQ
jgi:hypothetical protein